MAERRMFAKTIINSARFLRMPPTSRLLYYDLGMAADDDGVVEAFTVLRTTGAAEDDLRVLVSKGFVRVLNEDLVAWIVDWKANNSIKSDRYHPSQYQALLVAINDGTQTDPIWNTSGSNLEPEVRLGEDRIGENRQEKAKSNAPSEREAAFVRFWAAYPRKVGREAARKAFAKVKVDVTVLLHAIQEQKRSDQWVRDGGKFIPNPATWLNQSRWEDELLIAAEDKNRVRTADEYLAGY